MEEIEHRVDWLVTVTTAKGLVRARSPICGLAELVSLSVRSKRHLLQVLRYSARAPSIVIVLNSGNEERHDAKRTGQMGGRWIHELRGFYFIPKNKQYIHVFDTG